MKRLLCACTALALIAGCSKSQTASNEAMDMAMVKPTAPAMSPPAADAAAGEAAGVSGSMPTDKAVAGPKPVTAPVVTASTPMLAYSYSYAIETPADRLRGLIKAHEQACVTAGPAVCQMVGEHVNGVGKDSLEGAISLRATPAWLAVFRDGLDGQAKAAGGRVVNSATSSEDLSRSIVDTEAAIRARTTLRDRLQALLASHPGKLSDLLEVEQSLAQVQGEIDATQSELAVMRTRVATSALTVSYRSTGTMAPQGVWSPLKSAFDDALGLMVGVLSGLIRVIAALAPLIVILGGIAWLVRGRIARLAARRKREPGEPPPLA